MRPTTATGAAARAAGSLLVIATAVLVADAAPADAHATLIGTVPTADEVVDGVPDVVELQFDEPVETVDGAVEVLGPEGERVDVGAVETVDDGATVRASLEGDTAGTYTVAWRVTSTDSHTLTGSFVFHNGTETGAAVIDDSDDPVTAVAGGIGRWLGFGGLLAAAGAAALALLLPPGRRGPPAPAGDPDPAAGPEPDPADGRITAGTARGGVAGTAIIDPPERTTAAPRSVGATDDRAVAARLRTLAAWGALTGAGGALLALVATLGESAGRGLYDAIALVPDLAPDTRTGQLALLKVALALAAGAAAGVTVVWRRSPVPTLVLALAALATASFAGHAWTAPDRAVAVAADLVHLGAVALWVGGVVALLVALPLVPAVADRVRLATRFSNVALVAVGVVALSGTVSGWQQLGGLDDLTFSGYGQLLLAKVAGFAVLIGLGWANRARLVPLVERTVAPLRRSLGVETLVAATVLAVTAALIAQPPARTEVADDPFTTTAALESGEVLDATVDPAAAGTNDIHLYFYGEGAAPLAVDAVQVTASTDDVPARRLQPTPISTNHVIVTGASLPTAGAWTVEVTAVTAGEPLVFTFEVPIA